MSIRPATHAGSWYSGSASTLMLQLDAFTKLATPAQPVAGARVLIGPHAGYTYSGPRLSETFKAWDTTKVKRVFILGPSHHVYFKNKVLVSNYGYYETPLGNLAIDVETTRELTSRAGSPFEYMSDDVDDDEHSFELHAPFIYHATKALAAPPKIIPIMVCSTDDVLVERVRLALQPYFDTDENTFVISSDFCHWGTRFDYTGYLRAAATLPLSSEDVPQLLHTRASKLVSADRPIHQAIAELDREALAVMSRGSSKAWESYISATGNTICGQRPIGIVLRLAEHSSGAGSFEWLGYSQSNKAVKLTDSSVSYASGYMTMS